MKPTTLSSPIRPAIPAQSRPLFWFRLKPVAGFPEQVADFP